MKKRWLLFATVLLSMAALKYACAQDESAMNWDPVWQDDPIQDVVAVMVAAPILGVMFGAFRLLRTHSSRPVLLSLHLR